MPQSINCKSWTCGAGSENHSQYWVRRPRGRQSMQHRQDTDLCPMISRTRYHYHLLLFLYVCPFLHAKRLVSELPPTVIMCIQHSLSTYLPPHNEEEKFLYWYQCSQAQQRFVIDCNSVAFIQNSNIVSLTVARDSERRREKAIIIDDKLCCVPPI